MKPIKTQKREAQFRGPAQSDDYNERIEENYEDLTLLYNTTHLNAIELDELYSRMAKDHLSMSRELEALEARIVALEANSSYRTFVGVTAIENALFDGTAYEVESAERLTFDTVHNFFTLPLVTVGSRSKVLTTDGNGNEIVPPSFESRVVGDPASADTPAAYIDTTSPKNAFYSKPGLIWERSVVRDSAVAGGAEMDVYFRLPLELQTSDKSNAIKMHCFPYFGTKIKSISTSSTTEPTLDDSDVYTPINNSGYYDGQGEAVGWIAPGGWSDDSDSILNAGPSLFYFTPRQVTAVKVTMQQEDYYYDSNKYVYSYGMTSFDVRYDKFLSSGRAMIKVDAAASETISSVDNVTPDIYNLNPARISDAFSYRVIWETSPGSGTYQTTPVPSSNNVWIEVTLNEVDGITPMLSGFIVEYS